MSGHVHIPTLEANRAQLARDLKQVLEAPTRENRNLTADETARFKQLEDDIAITDGAIAEARQAERRGAAANQLRAQYGQTRPDGPDGPRWYAGADEVYRRGGNASYFQDLFAAQFRPAPDVIDRLQRHAQQMDQRLADPRGLSERARRTWVDGGREGGAPKGTEYRVNPNRTDGQGGYFVPPAWLIESYVDYARPARATADLCQPMALPAGTDSISVPRVTTGTATATQTELGAVASQDMTDDAVTAPVRTIAGQEDFSMQLLDQSPIGVDEVFFRDLQADYNQRLDIQVLTGSGTGNQHLGILNVSGINAITYTDATPTLAELYPVVPMAKSQVANGVYRPPTAQVWSAKRWYWAESILDSGSRPFVGGMGPTNALGGTEGTSVQGAAGVFANLPVVADPNVPANLGAGTNEDRIIVAAWPELLLWEGVPRMRLLQEVLSGNLMVRAQLYCYSAFMPHRRPKAISVISGTGLIVTTVLAGF